MREVNEFDKSMVGDRVWHPEHGWGTVAKRYFLISDLDVKFDCGLQRRFTCSGFTPKSRYDGSEEQELFWGETGRSEPFPENVRQRFFRSAGVLIDPNTNKFELGL